MGSEGIGVDQCVLEWQLDNNGQPLQDSDDSEGAEDADALIKSHRRTQGSVADETVRSPDAKDVDSSPDVTVPLRAQKHRDRDLRNTFLIDRDSDAKASWRRGQPWTGEWSQFDTTLGLLTFPP